MQVRSWMRRVLLPLPILMLVLSAGSAWAQQSDPAAANPLLSGGTATPNQPAASQPAATEAPASETPPSQTSSSEAGTSEAPAAQSAAPGFLHRLGVFLVDQQRLVNRAINQQLGAIKRGNDPLAIWSGLLIAFAYGVFHVLGPGHGKTVIAGYFLGHHASWRRGISMASWMAISHVVAAIGIVVVVHLILSRGFATPVDEMMWLRFVSYAAIVLIGLAMLIQAWRGQPVHACAHGHHHGHGHSQDHAHHDHGRHDHSHAHDHQCGPVSLRGDQGLLAVAAGFVPCSGAILILVFCLTNGLLWAGVFMTLMIALGMAVTLSAIGLGSIFLRRQTLGRVADSVAVARLLGFVGPLLITLIGVILLSGAMIAPDAM